jgi:ubiquinone/menaquinone biosynthesis C-methylase UbiE
LTANKPEPSAFAPDRSLQAAGAAVKAAWWTLAGMAARRLAGSQRTAAPAVTPSAEPAPKGFVRRAWLEAFAKDRRDVALGLYPAMDDGPADPVKAILAFVDLVGDAREVEARRRRNGAAEARADAPASPAYPAYYRQNFHFQTGGWFTAESARRYEGQVETLFAGAAGAMRRRALSLLAQAWRDRDQRDLAVADIACGSGGFLKDLARAFPRAKVFGVDLSLAYLEEARARAGASVVQAQAEHLPFTDESLDAAACIYLFHELPPRVRPLIAAELARVLKPGGLLAFADSIQPQDEPRMGRLLQVFPAYFHEPYYSDYGALDLAGLFGEQGLVERDRDRAFLTKAILFEKRSVGA